MKRFRIRLREQFDASLLSRVEEVFESESLVQVVVHAHLLLERAIITLLDQKLKRPEILRDGSFGRWTFKQKLGLYVALYDPPREQQQMLSRFNDLRNALAHRLDDPESAVIRFLPLNEHPLAPNARAQVWAVTAILFFQLGILQGLEPLEANEQSTNTAHKYSVAPEEVEIVASRTGAVAEDRSKGVDLRVPLSDQTLIVHFMHPRNSATSLTADLNPQCTGREVLQELIRDADVEGPFLPRLPDGQVYELIIHRTKQVIEPQMSFEHAGAIDGDWIDIVPHGCIGI
jgi:hypothetical protein